MVFILRASDTIFVYYLQYFLKILQFDTEQLIKTVIISVL